MDLTTYATDGYDGQPFQGYATSNAGMAHAAGKYWRENGRPRPTKCTTGRGYSVNMFNGRDKYQIYFDHDMRPSFSRP